MNAVHEQNATDGQLTDDYIIEVQPMSCSKIQQIALYVYNVASQRIGTLRQRCKQKGLSTSSSRSTSAPDSDYEDEPTGTLNGVLFTGDEPSIFPQELQHMVNSLDCMDLGFDANRVFRPHSRFQGITTSLRKSLPCYYIEVLEIPGRCNLSIFCLRRGGHEVPLHDHPGMYGLLKVIHGKVRIQSYSPMGNAMRQSVSSSKLVDGVFLSHHSASPLRADDDYRMLVRCDQDNIITADDPATDLRPRLRNLHRIVAVDGPAAFFDILVPPYDPPVRDCRYYTLEPIAAASPIIDGVSADTLPVNSDDHEVKDSKERLLTAHTIRAPETFYCESFSYMGPYIDRGQYLIQD